MKQKLAHDCCLHPRVQTAPRDSQSGQLILAEHVFWGQGPPPEEKHLSWVAA